MKKIISVCTLFAVAISMAAACTNEVEEPFENNVKNETQTIAVSSAEQNEIDLGLPSGTRWAEANLGAESETEPGLYYAWGDTNGYTKDSGHEFSISAYTESDSYPYAIFNNINITRDAANKRLGGSWRMPTKEECQKLKNNTNITETTIDGVNGVKFTSKTDASKYIFLPRTGYYNQQFLCSDWEYGEYWCSTYSGYDSYYGWHFGDLFCIDDFDICQMAGKAVWAGCVIRAVCE